MALTAGTKLGPYEIQSPLGAGGMGEVYRAKDTRLDRIVAIKVLPSHLSSDPELKQRMEREAKAISALQHANICTLFDIGSQDGGNFLVMEYLEGQTLADRLQKGPLPLDQILKIGTEIAQALEKAHQQGIIHRDLKPANIMLTKAGAKLMDFGLAKPKLSIGSQAIGPFTPSTPTMNLASLTSPASPLTQKGSIVGTFQYMAPEVLQGGEADARSDLFSFGCVLYEMVTGCRAFEGKSQLSVFTAILERDPEPLNAAQPLTPPLLDCAIRACLAKDPTERMQTAHDLAMNLRWVVTSASTESGKSSLKFNWSWVAGLGALLLVFAAIAGFVGYRSAKSSDAASSFSVESYILSPEKTSFTLANDDADGPVVLSPDGKKIAFVAQQEQQIDRIYVRALDEKDAKPVLGTENATYPFWSPDGQSLAFFSAGKLRRVSLNGGPILEICNATRFRGGSWAPEGILFAPDVTNGIFHVAPQAGSTPVQLTSVSPNQTTHRWPVWLPDGKHFLYLGTIHAGAEVSDSSSNASNGIYFASLDGKENRFVVAAESNMHYAQGHLLWEQSGSLLAQPFDPATGKLSGESVALAAGVGYNPSTWNAAFDANENGVLVYQPGPDPNSRQLLLFDKDGKSVPVPDSNSFMDIRISPDGRKAAAMTGGTSREIWLLDLDQGTRTRFTFGYTADGMAWSGDSKYLYYSEVSKTSKIVRKAADGSGQQTTVFEDPRPLHVTDVSSDGRYVLFEQTYGQIPTTTLLLQLTDGAKPRPLTDYVSGAHYARFSPDSKWVAYSTVETGRYELYATSVLQGGKQQLTSTGGWLSRWAADGKTIYATTIQGPVFALPLSVTSTSIEAGKGRPLFTFPGLQHTGFYTAAWDATPDGRHFLLNVTGENWEESRAILVTNWPARLKK
jgi:serine/threonine protein kinase